VLHGLPAVRRHHDQHKPAAAALPELWPFRRTFLPRPAVERADVVADDRQQEGECHMTADSHSHVRTVDPTDTLAVLKAAEEWLSDPEHWTTGAYWRAADDCVARSVDEVARTCAVGALSYVVGARVGTGWPGRPYAALAAALGAKRDMSAINDEPGGYPKVMAGLRKAIEALEAAR
jgi:hypothetical protein